MTENRPLRRLYRSLCLLVALAAPLAPALAQQPRLENESDVRWFLTPVRASVEAAAKIQQMTVTVAFAEDTKEEHTVDFNLDKPGVIEVPAGVRVTFRPDHTDTEMRCSAQFELWTDGLAQSGSAKDRSPGEPRNATHVARVEIQAQGVVPQSFRNSRLMAVSVSDLERVMEIPLMFEDMEPEVLSMAVELDPQSRNKGFRIVAGGSSNQWCLRTTGCGCACTIL